MQLAGLGIEVLPPLLAGRTTLEEVVLDMVWEV